MPARLRIGHKLTLALAVLLLTTVAVAVVGLSSVSDVNRRATALYADNIRTTETTSALWGGLYEAEESAFQLLLVSSAAERSELEDELDESLPKVESAIVALRQIHVSDAPVEKARVEQIVAGWLEFERLWRSGALASGDPKARRRVTARVAAVLEPATELAAALAATEGREARESQARAEATYRAARLRIVVLSVGSVLVCLLIALALIRDLVPRLRSYSTFAGRVGDGQLGEPECPLYASLQGAKPRACLAVRFGRVHQGGPDREPLLRCQVCSGLPEATTCEPLLVSGQVIGSVLVDHPAGTEVGAPIRESVMQAAPVLANLRNLAIAEIRAATDALTGLPNNRAVQDTLRRMVAQASRTVSPLSAARSSSSCCPTPASSRPGWWPRRRGPRSRASR